MSKIDFYSRFISRIFALSGGFIILALATMTVASVLGRTFLGQSIQGDYELTEVGLSISIFLFLPYCYLNRGHIIVDLFTSGASESTIKCLDGFGKILFLAVCIMFSIKMVSSGIEAFQYYEQTMLLELSWWYVYVIGFLSFSFTSFLLLISLLQKKLGGTND